MESEVFRVTYAKSCTLPYRVESKLPDGWLLLAAFAEKEYALDYADVDSVTTVEELKVVGG